MVQREVESANDPIAFVLNGARVAFGGDPGRRLIDVLRDEFGLTGAKEGCGEGACGSCTVLIDGTPTKSCVTKVSQIGGRHVSTIEGMGTFEDPHPLQRAFVENGAIQCGFCTPGMLLRAKALLDRNPSPTRHEIKQALRGNVCRCTGYKKIVEAVESAAGVLSGTRVPTGSAAPIPTGACVGVSVPQEGVWDKALGKTRYAADLTPSGCVHLAVVRSTEAHALLIGIDASTALTIPGVLAVFTAEDVAGTNRTGAILHDKPVLAGDKVRFLGDAVALVAGETVEAAQAGAKAVRVEYEKLPVHRSPEEASAPCSTLIHDTGNVLVSMELRKGDASLALASAPVVVEGTFETSFVAHAYLEPEAGLAWIDDNGRIVLRLSTQNPHENREQVTEALGLGHGSLRVTQAPTGGAFGGKVTHDLAAYLALATHKLQRPTKLVFSRGESLLTTDKRHPFSMRLRLGAAEDGKLLALTADMTLDGGAYASWSKAVAERALIHVSGPYEIPGIHARAKVVYTNNTPAGAMRGFGSPQTSFANEALMDQLADRLSLDPVELRRRNIFHPGSVTATGQVLETSVGAAKTLEAIAPYYQEALAWADEPTDRDTARGVGVASVFFGISEGGIRTHSEIGLRLTPEGTIQLLAGAPDLGQGVFSVLRQIAAQTMGVPLDYLVLVLPDTDLMPSAGATEASRQTFVSGNAVMRAAEQLLERLGRLPLKADRALDPRAWLQDAYAVLTSRDEPVEEFGYFEPQNRPIDKLGQGVPHVTYSFASHLAEVEVDQKRGSVRVHRMVTAHDVGKPMNPCALEGQIEGGLMMALGMALSEEYRPGKTDRLSGYKVPRTTDLPDIVNIIVDEVCPYGPYGAKGVGEIPAVGPASAISNAVARATGVRPIRLPIEVVR